MSNIDVAFTTLLVLSLIGLILVLRYNHKMRKLHKK